MGRNGGIKKGTKHDTLDFFVSVHPFKQLARYHPLLYKTGIFYSGLQGEGRRAPPSGAAPLAASDQIPLQPPLSTFTGAGRAYVAPLVVPWLCLGSV